MLSFFTPTTLFLSTWNQNATLLPWSIMIYHSLLEITPWIPRKHTSTVMGDFHGHAMNDHAMHHFPIKDSSFNSRSFWKATRNHHCRSHLKSWRRVSSLHWTLLLKAGFPVALLIYCVWSQVDSSFRKNSKCTWLWLWFQKIASHLLFCYFCFNWGDSQEKNTINTDHREPFRNRPRAFFCFTFSRFWDLRP